MKQRIYLRGIFRAIEVDLEASTQAELDTLLKKSMDAIGSNGIIDNIAEYLAMRWKARKNSKVTG